MARSRTIKPGFFANEVLAECSPLSRLLFAASWCHADCNGNLEDRPRRLKLSCLPYDDCDVDELINELVAHEFLIRYEVDGGKYLHINNFERHQNPHCQEKAMYPEMSFVVVQHQPSTILARAEHQPSTEPALYEHQTTVIGNRETVIGEQEKGEGKQEEGSQDGVIPDPPPDDATEPKKPETTADDHFDAFWWSFPSIRKRDKGTARKAWAKAITRAPPETIVKAAIEYAESEIGRSEFAKMPATWLNGDCWDDDRRAWLAIRTLPSHTKSNIQAREDFLNATDGQTGVFGHIGGDG